MTTSPDPTPVDTAALIAELNRISDEALGAHPGYFTAGCVVPDVRLLKSAASALESLSDELAAARQNVRALGTHSAAQSEELAAAQRRIAALSEPSIQEQLRAVAANPLVYNQRREISVLCEHFADAIDREVEAINSDAIIERRKQSEGA